MVFGNFEFMQQEENIKIENESKMETKNRNQQRKTTGK